MPKCERLGPPDRRGLGVDRTSSLRSEAVDGRLEQVTSANVLPAPAIFATGATSGVVVEQRQRGLLRLSVQKRRKAFFLTKGWLMYP